MKKLIIFIAVILSIFFYCESFAEQRITQASFVHFKENQCIVLAVESLNKQGRILFFNEKDNGLILHEEIFSENSSPGIDEEGSPYIYSNPFIRFKIVNIKELPNQIVLGLAVIPAGSCTNYEVKIISELNSKIELLNPEPIILSTLEGFYLGYINKKYGSGLVLWHFEWDAAHYEPHRYRIEIFSWNGKAFKLAHKFTTKAKFDSGCDALASNNLPCKNFIYEISQEEEINTINSEDEFLKNIR